MPVSAIGSDRALPAGKRCRTALGVPGLLPAMGDGAERPGRTDAHWFGDEEHLGIEHRCFWLLAVVKGGEFDDLA
jgi:hypothetical protein